MKLSHWLQCLVPNRPARSRRHRAGRRSTSPAPVESLESRLLLAADLGDAPAPYATTLADDGPRHTLVVTIKLGALIDGELDGQPDADSVADDNNGVFGDDEDGVLSPLDLTGTAGTAPSVTLLATNNTVWDATLAGWIDYDADGVFDDATERATINVPTGTTDGRFTLNFPVIPDTSSGPTQARFRISSHANFVANPTSTGTAFNGEVEDYRFTITQPGSGRVRDFLKIGDGLNGLPAGTLDDRDNFGWSVASLGDVDGDGVTDIAVGAGNDEHTGNIEGAVYILFLNADGSVKSHQKISDGLGGLPSGSLDNSDFFGSAVASLGDLDSDGVVDLAVGALGNGTVTATSNGAVHILFLNADGTVKRHQEISNDDGGLVPGTLVLGDRFGESVATLGDLDGDGVVDLAVGAVGDDNTDFFEGAVYILNLNDDGTVKSQQKLGDGLGGLPAGLLDRNDKFGESVAALGDLDGDGVVDLAVGTGADGHLSGSEGAVYAMLLNPDGTVKSHVKIGNGIGGFPTGILQGFDSFGTSIAAIGDLDGDGVTDLAVGADTDGYGSGNEGAVFLLRMNSDGTVRSHQKIANGLGGLPWGSLEASGRWGRSIASLGDFDGDGLTDLVVGSETDDEGGMDRGAIRIVNLAPEVQSVSHIVGRDAATGDWQIARSDGNSFTSQTAGNWDPNVGWVNAHTADVNGDGHDDLIGRDANSGDWWVGLSDGVGNFTNQNWGLWVTYVTWLDVNIADVNGDGNDDIVGRQQSNGNWWVAVSDGAGGFTNQLYGFWDPTVTWLDVNVADVNGDGYDDVVGRQQSNGNWWVAVADGLGSFTNQLWGNWTPITWVDVNIADVNGDGFDDVIGRQDSNGNWWVSVSDGAGSFTNQLWGNFTAIPWDDVTVADVNGDGNDDVVARQQSNGNWWVGLSDGVGAFTNQQWGYWDPTIAWVDVSFGDVDGDGDDDIIGREQSNGRWWVGRSDGASSFSNELWGTWDPAVAWTDVALLDDLLAV